MTLVGHWPLDEDSGTTAFDYSGFEYTGTVNGATLGAAGPLNPTVYSFDGVDDSVSLPAMGFSGDTSITIEAWLKPASGAASSMVVFGFGESTTDNSCVLRTGGDGGFKFYFWGNDLAVSGPAYYGSWTHVVARYDASASTRDIWMNGTRLGSDSPTNPNFSNIDYRIGVRQNDATEYFEGEIGPVRVWDHPLTPTEIQYLASISQDASRITDQQHR